MKDYELTLVIDPDLTSENQKKLISTIKKTIDDLNGRIKEENEWGKKELAYPIKKRTSGFYFSFLVNFPESIPGELFNKLKQEAILRYLLVKLEKPHPPARPDSRGKSRRGREKGGKNGPKVAK